MTGEPLEWLRLSASAPQDRRAALDLLREAFPPEQRVPEEDLLAGDRAGAAPVEVVRRAGEVAALVAVWPLAPGWSLLAYIAVDRRLRGGGVGGAVWRGAMGRLAPGEALLLEIEHPFLPGLDPAAREQRVRRLRFYTRLGARLLRAPGYAAPSADGGEPIPMLLMAAPGRRAAMPAEEVRGLIAATHRLYGMAPDDPLTARALASAR